MPAPPAALPRAAQAVVGQAIANRASGRARRNVGAGIIEAPVEDTIEDLGATSGYRILERATR